MFVDYTEQYKVSDEFKVDDYNKFKRHNSTDEITKHGFNIKEEAKKVNEIYEKYKIKFKKNKIEN